MNENSISRYDPERVSLLECMLADALMKCKVTERELEDVKESLSTSQTHLAKNQIELEKLNEMMWNIRHYVENQFKLGGIPMPIIPSPVTGFQVEDLVVERSGQLVIGVNFNGSQHSLRFKFELSPYNQMGFFPNFKPAVWKKPAVKRKARKSVLKETPPPLP